VAKLEEQPSNLNLVSNLQTNLINPQVILQSTRPLWLSPVFYLFIVLAISLAIFFLVWIVFYDEENQSTWIPATTAFALFFGIAIVARKVVLQRIQTRYLLQQNNSFDSAVFARNKRRPKKFTLDENSAVLNFIQKKSSDAFALDSTLAKHFEVFNLCQKYLDFVASELKDIRPGSPRLLALKKGRADVSELHKKHLLVWASGETQNLTKEVAVRATMPDKLESAQRALGILNAALGIYPNEAKLFDSISVIEEFIISIRVAHWVELAERSVFKKHYRRAVDHYQDALFYLERESSTGKLDHEIIRARLNDEIKRLRKLVKQKKQDKS
jgi:hypothetical protein